MWGVLTSCDQLIRGLLLDLGIVVVWSTFDCHLVLMLESERLVLGVDRIRNFGGVGQNVHGGL